jgi:hypothetical protein
VVGCQKKKNNNNNNKKEAHWKPPPRVWAYVFVTLPPPPVRVAPHREEHMTSRTCRVAWLADKKKKGKKREAIAAAAGTLRVVKNAKSSCTILFRIPLSPLPTTFNLDFCRDNRPDRSQYIHTYTVQSRRRWLLVLWRLRDYMVASYMCCECLYKSLEQNKKKKKTNRIKLCEPRRRTTQLPHHETLSSNATVRISHSSYTHTHTRANTRTGRGVNHVFFFLMPSRPWLRNVNSSLRRERSWTPEYRQEIRLCTTFSRAYA